MRLYTHLFDARGCEAPGCRARRTSLYPRRNGLIRACNPLHAAAADARLSEEEARQVEAEQHYVEGVPFALDEPQEGGCGWLWLTPPPGR
jgi:hypothetical protein